MIPSFNTKKRPPRGGRFWIPCFFAKGLLKHVLTSRSRRLFTMMMVKGHVLFDHNLVDCNMSKEGCKVQLLILLGLKLIPDLLGKVTA